MVLSWPLFTRLSRQSTGDLCREMSLSALVGMKLERKQYACSAELGGTSVVSDAAAH